jgi:hypothetical protein
LYGIWRAIIVAFRTFAAIWALEDAEKATFEPSVMEIFCWRRMQSFSDIGAVDVLLYDVGSLVEKPVFNERADVGDMVVVEACVYRVDCLQSYGNGVAACVRLKFGDMRLVAWRWELEILLHPLFDDDTFQRCGNLKVEISDRRTCV